MSKKINILGVNFNHITMEQAIDIVIGFLNSKEKLHMIFTPNPEIVMIAQKEIKLQEILNHSDLVVPDGIGIVKAAKILKDPLTERVAGYDLVQNVFEKISKTNHTVYFLGGAKEVADQAAKNMQEKYPGLKIIGCHDGYFSKNEEMTIIQEINELKPDLLLVGLGAPRQEMWLYDNRKKLNAKACIGVGGSFDVMSGKVKRAPKWMIKSNLEWFYRLLVQPTRIKRMINLPIFMLKVLVNKKKALSSRK
ncbi:N-acetylglucosaminyldiphosphoundecaprenol N-acetyl-beta-D-mannosaminyltransferase [Natranaerovirga hydrolytica]|uniref:N-acetylglucosaminyldiphosphoundecaprenol N-acetyl-beta-D-mannosaminyltransferase n=1 Tax=Natranaerovirga hydrolytica TaxID=680378 RepID=A0A4R1MLQ0_9FIRM|nr:WecB/TagA/CpsF family glycosyltransferase [Natranaerovirga hydrolytica]TCK93465.1 N-acetylglucosaminyldiphosphoundecaprenol N-acetyl-beta-D-mannosaminyltransferase [Natranaerovirga hydrolytica]